MTLEFWNKNWKTFTLESISTQAMLLKGALGLTLEGCSKCPKNPRGQGGTASAFFHHCHISNIFYHWHFVIQRNFWKCNIKTASGGTDKCECWNSYLDDIIKCLFLSFDMFNIFYNTWTLIIAFINTYCLAFIIRIAINDLLGAQLK